MEYIEGELLRWKESDKRMSLLIRGARQVGEKSSVRHLGQCFKMSCQIKCFSRSVCYIGNNEIQFMLRKTSALLLAQGEKRQPSRVDFVVQVGQKIVPLEVKSGPKGSMQSLGIFMKEKGAEYGVRTSM